METTPQFHIFKDCLARRIISQVTRDESSEQSSSSSTELVDDFASFLASESWPILPPALQHATHESLPDDVIDTLSLDATSPAFTDTLVSYRLSSDPDAALVFLRKTIADYVAEACAPPPVWKSTRTRECEICEREVRLTYHHLIPRSTHAKVLKKKWHPESMLNSVAWLCRHCHSTVHHVASNEELARHFYTVELLLQREDIQRWKAYAAKQRFGFRWSQSRETALPEPEHHLT